MTTQMDDRTLLERAAKAAGIEIEFKPCSKVPYYRGNERTQIYWNPLTDDGDAFRLAAKLYLHINHFRPNYPAEVVQILPGTHMCGTVEVQREDDDDPLHTEWYKAGADVCAATRRAIVRAAAALGAQTAKPEEGQDADQA